LEGVVLVKRVTNFLGEYIALEDIERNDIEQIIQITKVFMLGPIEGQYYSFIDGMYYKAKLKPLGQIDIAMPGQINGILSVVYMQKN
jgi:hypothetical protein